MTIERDPEGNETRALFGLADFSGKHVLEIGCGAGRLTWRFADHAAHVTAIEPFEESFERAVHDLPDHLDGRVELQNIAFLDFAAEVYDDTYDVIILSWSLC